MTIFGCSSFNSYCNGIQALYFKCHAFQRLPLSFFYSSISTTKEGNQNNPSSSIPNYFVESLGFSTHQSLSTYSKLLQRSRRIKVDNKLINNNVDVVNFFKKLGFQNPDIRKMVSREPRILTVKVEQTLKPKINLLLDLGFCMSDLILTISSNPGMLKVDLGSAILAFKTIFGCDQDVIRVLKRTPGKYVSSVKNCIANFELLRKDYGIPGHKIQKFILRNPRCLLLKIDMFRDRLIKVEEKLGIPRESEMFLYGIQLLVGLSDKKIEDKCQIFRSLGWTQSDVTELIRRNPMCLTASEANIKERLDVLMNQMGFELNYLKSKPTLFTYSIKKRLLPRHNVLQVLKEKGIVRMDYSFVTAAGISEPIFLKRFVLPFEEVHQVYAQLTGRTVSSLLKEDQS